MPKNLSWKPVTLVLVVVVAIGALTALRFWERAPKPEGEEHVWVQYRASFKLLSIENNTSVENLIIIFPYPHVYPQENVPEPTEIAPLYENFQLVYTAENENYLSPTFTPVDTKWNPVENWLTRWYQDNVEDIQEQWGEGNKFSGKIILRKIQFNSTRIGENDEILVEMWFKITAKDMRKMTLIDNIGVPGTSTGGLIFPCPQYENLGIEIKMSAETRKDGVVLEKVSIEGSGETGGPSGVFVFLYPI